MTVALGYLTTKVQQSEGAYAIIASNTNLPSVYFRQEAQCVQQLVDIVHPDAHMKYVPSSTRINDHSFGHF